MAIPFRVTRLVEDSAQNYLGKPKLRPKTQPVINQTARNNANLRKYGGNQVVPSPWGNVNNIINGYLNQIRSLPQMPDIGTSYRGPNTYTYFGNANEALPNVPSTINGLNMLEAAKKTYPPGSNPNNEAPIVWGVKQGIGGAQKFFEKVKETKLPSMNGGESLLKGASQFVSGTTLNKVNLKYTPSGSAGTTYQDSAGNPITKAQALTLQRSGKPGVFTSADQTEPISIDESGKMIKPALQTTNEVPVLKLDTYGDPVITTDDYGKAFIDPTKVTETRIVDPAEFPNGQLDYDAVVKRIQETGKFINPTTTTLFDPSVGGTYILSTTTGKPVLTLQKNDMLVVDGFEQPTVSVDRNGKTIFVQHPVTHYLSEENKPPTEPTFQASVNPTNNPVYGGSSLQKQYANPLYGSTYAGGGLDKTKTLPYKEGGYTYEEVFNPNASPWRPGYDYSKNSAYNNPYPGNYYGTQPVVSGYYLWNGKYYPINNAPKNTWGQSGYGYYGGGGGGSERKSVQQWLFNLMNWRI